VSTTLPSQIEVFQLADGVHFRLPPPAGSYPGDRHEVCITIDGKLRWKTGSGSSPAHELAVEDLAQLVVGPFGDLAVLSAETRQGGPHAICTGYPRHWLEALAVVLRGHCRVPTQTGSDLKPSPAPQAMASPAEVIRQLGKSVRSLAAPADQRAAAVHQLGESLRSLYEDIQAASARVPEFQENPDQPPNSRVIHQVHDNGVTLIVPPGGPGLFFLLGCVLCGIAALPTLGLIAGGFGDADSSYGPYLTVGILWAIALAVFLPVYHHAYAHVALAVVGDELEMIESSKVHTRRRSWNRADLTDVRSGDNGWASGGDDSNLTPVAELHILPKGAKKVGLLAGRDAAEVRWIATVLRRALRLPHPY
jgi:hypothetical protein